MRYRTQSANVLNEADRFEQSLNLTLFAEEQDRRLWGPNSKIDWVPGTPLYKDPRDIAPYTFDEQEFNLWCGYWGNHVRPMFEELDDGDIYGPMRCLSCEVSWRDGDDCWICGKTYPSPMTFNSNPMVYWGLSGGPYLEYSYVPLSFTDVEIAAWERVNRDFSIGAQRASRAMAGFGRSMQNTMAGFGQSMQNTLNELRAFIDDTSAPFHPEPVVVCGIELPENWADLSHEIPLPSVPEPPDYSHLNIYRSGPSRSGIVGRR